VLVPLREPSRAAELAARVRELNNPVRKPRAAAVMLRALAALDKPLAGTVGCEVIATSPADFDHAGREAVVEAALVAIANAGTGCNDPLSKTAMEAQMREDACLPYFRCGDTGPLSGRETSKQDEALCTKEQLAAAVAKELERAPADVLAMASGTRPQLFTYAALLAMGQVPATFTTAHARRRYALVQPAEPSCESGVAVGTACHCDEATVRDQTCRQPVSNSVHVGVCKFEVDDKQKKLLNVVSALAP
jgi:hypothetical protein